MSPTPAQSSLKTFYESVKITNPRTAALMHADVLKVAIFSLAADKAPAQTSANNLRLLADDLPEIQRRVLENALIGLGFPNSG